jgi:hypothetical protein
MRVNEGNKSLMIAERQVKEGEEKRTYLTTPPTLTLQTTPFLNFPIVSSLDILVPGTGFLTPHALPNSSSSSR